MTTPAQNAARDRSQDRSELPATAGSSPLVALLGLGSLLLAAAVRGQRFRT